MGTKVMILQCNVLSWRSEPLGSCHCDAKLVVLVYFANELWCGHMNWKYSVDLSKKSNYRNDIAQCLQKSNVLGLGGA